MSSCKSKIVDLKNGCNNFISLVFRVEKMGELRSFNSDGKIKTVYNATIFDGDTFINVTGWDNNRYQLKEKQVYLMENPLVKFNSYTHESEIIINEQTVIKSSEEKLESEYDEVSNDGDHCKTISKNLKRNEDELSQVSTETGILKSKSYDSRIIFPFR